MAQVEIQHRNLTDPQIHEPKGASTATTGQIWVSNGQGSGSFTNITPANLTFTVASFNNTTMTADVPVRTLSSGLSGTLTNALTDASTFAQVNKNCKELYTQVKNADDMIAVLKTNITELNRVVMALKNQMNVLTFTEEESNDSLNSF